MHFEQVRTYVGPVPPATLHEALLHLLRLPHGENDEVVLFALDGTLLNLLRWGCIVNDNDLDVGFFFRRVALTTVSEHYFLLHQRLAEAGFVDPISERRRRRLWAPQGTVKIGRCKYRGQIMQCRHRNGVIVDFFGPNALFSSLTELTPRDVVPLRNCRAFNGTFPCPAHYLRVLKNFTLDFSAKSSAGAPVRWREFDGCAMYSRNAAEHTPTHLRSIYDSAAALRACGFPNLMTDYDTAECTAIRDRNGVGAL